MTVDLGTVIAEINTLAEEISSFGDSVKAIDGSGSARCNSFVAEINGIAEEIAANNDRDGSSVQHFSVAITSNAGSYDNQYRPFDCRQDRGPGGRDYFWSSRGRATRLDRRDRRRRANGGRRPRRRIDDRRPCQRHRPCQPRQVK